MKKGFTLIELLAVIVILAIIALIATPIIINIIENSRGESEKRSIELYASAIKNAIAGYQLTHPEAPTSIDDLTVEYDGNVECTTKEIYEDGNVYLSNCKVNDNLVEGYTYGTKQYIQVYKPQYYSCSGGGIGDNLPSDAKENATELTINAVYPFYLGLDVDSYNKVTAAYVCFFKNDKEYCLKGYDTESYETNQGVLNDAFKGESACYFRNSGYVCLDVDFGVAVDSNGYVDADFEDEYISYCVVVDDNEGGSFECVYY